MRQRQIIYASTIIVLGFFSDGSMRHGVEQYDNCHCAWDSLLPCAWLVLEQYDNWQVVFQRAVAFHAPPGEFHPPHELSNVGSTIIVLGEFQPKSLPGKLGSTIIITNHLNYKDYEKGYFDSRHRGGYARILREGSERIKFPRLLRGREVGAPRVHRVLPWQRGLAAASLLREHLGVLGR